MARETAGLRRRLDRSRREREHATYRGKTEEKALEAARGLLAAAAEAQANLQLIAQTVQAVVHARVGDIVSKCLTAVFDEPYEVKVEFEKKRGKTEAQFVYYKNGHRLSHKVTSGGVRQVVSFALRLVKLTLGPPAAKTLFLDEPFAGLDKDNLPRVARLLDLLSKDMGLQFVIATHSDHLESGKIVRL